MSYQTAGMETVQRIKRQNCGDNVPGHHNLILGNRDQIGSRVGVANAEAEGIMNHSPRTMFARCHGSADQGNRKVNEYYFQRGPSEIGSSSFTGFPSYAGNVLRNPASERDSPHYRATGPMGNFINSPQSCTGSRASCKRKSSMDEVLVSVGSLSFRPFIEQRESDFSRFTEVAGTSRTDSAFPSTSSSTLRIPVLDDLPYSRDSHMMYQPLRPRPSHHVQIGSNRFYGGHGPQELCHAPYAQNNRVASDSLQSNMWTSRGTPSHEHLMQSTWSSHEFSAFNQGNASSALVPWCGNGSVSGERINHPHFQREYSAGLNMGSHPRNFSNGASIWMGVPPWTQSLFEPSSNVLTGLPYRESSSQGSQMAPVRHMHSSPVALSQPLPPQFAGHSSPYSHGCLLPYTPSSHAAVESVIFGSQAAPGNAYSSLELLNRSAMLPPLSGSAESGASPLPNFYGMPFEAERGGGPPRLPTHGTFDHAFIYNGFDAYDQHLGLQPDVDNMSYEELLALEERIGNVNIGLSVENICKCLKTSKHSSYDVTRSAVSQESEIKCSICQEEYIEGDEIGQLDCIHSYHTGCIKQWLMLKNQCPICKAAALSLS